MRRGIGRLRAGGGGFNPATIFAAGAAGMWLAPYDITTGFQDSAGSTPQTASGQQTGKRLDKSGRANHVIQATAGSRPEYDVISGISSDFFDGLDDNYATGSFVAGTLTSSMDCFVAVKRSGAGRFVLLSQDAGVTGGTFFADASTDPTTAAGVGASYTCFVDGVQLGGVATTTGTQLDTAIGNGSWHVMEYRALDLSLWTKFTISGFPTYMYGGDIGGVILCPAQSTATRDSIRKFLGAKVGLTL